MQLLDKVNTVTEHVRVYFKSFQKNIDLLANHILVIIAFFLSINVSVLHDGFQILLILFLLKPNKLELLIKVFNNRVVMSFVLFVVMNYVWILVSDDQVASYSAAKSMKFFLFSMLVYAFAQYRFVNRILAAFVLGVVVSAAFSYALSFQLIEPNFLYSNERVATYENPSPFVWHIDFGFILVFSSILLIQRLSIIRSQRKFLLISILFIFLSLCLFLNIARSGYILYGLGLLLFFVVHYRKNAFKLFPVIFLLISLLSSIAYTSLPIVEKRVNTLVNSVEKMYYDNNYKSSVGMRLKEYEQAYILFLDKPLLGYGTGMHVKTMYKDAVEKKIFYANSIKNYCTTDSQYFDILLQFGLIGLFVFLNIFYQVYKNEQNDTQLKEIQILFIILYLMFSLQSPSTTKDLLSYIFFFILTLTTVRRANNDFFLDPLSIKQFLFYTFFGINAFLLAPYIL